MWNIQRMSFYVENLHLHNNFFVRVIVLLLKRVYTVALWAQRPIMDFPGNQPTHCITTI